MQISSSSPSGSPASASSATVASANTSRGAADSAAPKEATQTPPASSAKVTLSDEAKKKHYESKDAATDASDNRPQLSRNKSAIPSAESEKPPSTVKSLVYGALNLPSPAEQQKNPDKAYSAGKWVGAVGTVIGIATLLARFI